MKYAIKVPIDDGWLYVTETDKDGNLIAKTFDTREEAEAFNSVSLSQVVEYQDNKNEHGYCPNCGKDFDGTLIWDTFFDRYGDVDKADEAAASYGATRDHGKWGLKIGIYSMEEDCTTHWKCPDCEHEWTRE